MLIIILFNPCLKIYAIDKVEFLSSEVDCKPQVGYQHTINTYCGKYDLNLIQPTLITKNITDALEGESLVKLRIAIWAITDISFSTSLCNLISTTTQEISLSVQKDTKSEKALEKIKGCALEKGVKNIHVSFNGLVVGGVNSYHPKLIYLQTPTREISLIGSGNITNTRNNFDYFIKIPVSNTTDNKQKNLVGWVNCVTEKLNSDNFDGFKKTIFDIKMQCNSFNNFDELFLLPADSKQLLIRMSFLSGKYKNIKIMTQGFNSPDVFFICKQMLLDGKKVQIILDDDIYWAKFDPKDGLMNQEYEYNNFVKPLLELGADVKYLITNHNEIIGNYQHSKMYLFSNEDLLTVGMFGSVNSTSSAFGDNVETAIQLNSEVAKVANSWFDELWDRAVAYNQMPDKDPLR